MSDEMVLESVPWESDESEDSESDEAFIESDESDEDYGEARSSRASRQRRRVNRYLPVKRGVNGVRFRGPNGQVTNLPFPTKLATAAETNRGLASQEVGRRALAERLDKLEAGTRVQLKKDGAVSGSVYLAIGGGLTAWSLFQASQRPVGTPFFSSWVAEDTARMATLASAGQLATSGAKWLINGKYHRSGVGMVADAFSVAQILGFTFGSLYTPGAAQQVGKKVADKAARIAAAGAVGAQRGDVLAQEDTGEVFELRAIAGAGAGLVAVRL
jgi:hypothetical protein